MNGYELKRQDSEAKEKRWPCRACKDVVDVPSHDQANSSEMWALKELRRLELEARSIQPSHPIVLATWKAPHPPTRARRCVAIVSHA